MFIHEFKVITHAGNMVKANLLLFLEFGSKNKTKFTITVQ